METLRLICHADTPSRNVSAIAVDLRKNASAGLDILFSVEDSKTLVLPAPAQSVRRDRLWQATAFELFTRTNRGNTYQEFNFSPSGEWAAYAFEDYREGMRDLPLESAPLISTDKISRRFSLAVTLPAAALPTGDVQIGLSAVILESGDAKSYWALAHPPGDPDFHHVACFAVTLPAPELS